MIRASELKKWLKTLPVNAEVAVDEGGLTLVVIDDKETYLEVGGVPEASYVNYYLCPNDGTLWDDTWSCMCNDRCPKCDAEIEPYASDTDDGLTVHAKDVYERACKLKEAQK